jgi:hypothetical protein
VDSDSSSQAASCDADLHSKSVRLAANQRACEDAQSKTAVLQLSSVFTVRKEVAE